MLDQANYLLYLIVGCVFSPNIVRVIKSRRLRWAGHVARMEEGRSVFKILTRKRPLGRTRHRWEDSIRIDLKETGVNTRNCTYLDQDRDLVNLVVSLRVL